jgi:ABC-type antimicrobial peptide transport system permease subunit
MALTIRTEGDPLSLAAAVRGAVKELNSNVPITRIRTMEEIVAGSISGRRTHLLLVGLFATLAAGLAALGIYGLLSFVVSQRTHEIGVRMALGASGSEVRAILVSQTALLGGIGVGFGTAGAIAVTRVLESMLYAVQPTDPATLAVSAIVLFGMVLLASYVPAHRATRIDPLVALRCE